MTTTDELRELTRQTRSRLEQAQRLRREQAIIVTQTDRRLDESRRLLDRSARRERTRAGGHLHRV